ncbi:hypothetical protein ABFX02_06G157400 [Erythranthe guttata]
MFSTTHFVNSHSDRKPDEESVIFISRSREKIQTIDKIEFNAVSRPIEIKPTHDWFKVLGSCDGLILLQTFECRIFLINPVTVEILEVPPATENRRRTYKYGFGYDPSNDEYKIVEARYSKPPIEKSNMNMAVDVYYVNQGFWKRVEDSPVHSVTIAAFDLAREVFDEIPLPSGISLKRIIWRCKLVVFEGCLCLVESKCNSENDLWTMKEYWVAESWTKYTFFDGDEMLLSSLNKLQFYNLKELSLRDDLIDAGPDTVYDEAWPFVGSIISPSVGSRLSGKRSRHVIS